MDVRDRRARVAVGFLGKWKTTVQVVGISLMLCEAPLLGIPTYVVAMMLLFVAAGLTTLSMIDYLRAAWPMLADRE